MIYFAKYYIKLFCLFFFLSLCTNVYAQPPYFSWGKSGAGAGSNDPSWDVSINSKGSIFFVANYLDASTDFDSGAGTATLTAVGGNDIAVVKYSSGGSYTSMWGIGSTGEDTAKSITIDGNDNLLIAGTFSATADFDPSGSTANLTSNGNLDIFFAKYDSSSTYSWAYNIGSTSKDAATAIAVDGSSNVYVAGYFQGTMDLDPGAGTSTVSCAGGTDAFVAKYNSSGVYQWGFAIGGTSGDNILSLEIDGSSNVLVSGYFNGTIDLDPGVGTATVTSAGGADAFLAKYNSSGTYQWGGKIGGTGKDVAPAIDHDGSDNVYITGEYTGTAIDFDIGAGSYTLTAATIGQSMFVAKYNSSGTIQFANSFGCSSTACTAFGSALCLDASDNVYLGGSFSGSIDWDPGAGTASLTGCGFMCGSYDGLIAKYNSSGTYQWAAKFGYNPTESVVAMKIDLSGNPVFTGNFTGGMDIDPTTGSTTIVTGAPGHLVAKWTTGNPLPIELLEFNARSVENKEVELTWTTTSETNNSYFTIERSKDAEAFESIATIVGAGNSNSLKNYQFTDKSPYKGVSYYRLKQTDFDGKEESFEIKSVELFETDFSITCNNPVNIEEFDCTTSIEKGKKMEITFTDMYGRIVYSSIKKYEEIQDAWQEIKQSKVTSGIYLLSVNSDTRTNSLKIVITAN
ncbi:MAG: T9SS type A sorting domain-containing protein [Bacteroidetes bacterium]|nr:T9SS type A sorting domain-containing protein [Bacteroidota bacterium]